MSESDFERYVIKRIENLFPGCIVLKNDPSYIQGFPDRTILYYDRWAALEIKDSDNAAVQPNQKYWVDRAMELSYGSFVYPGKLKEVLDELRGTFRT